MPGLPRGQWKPGTERVSFRLAKTQMEQVEFLMKETHRSKANTIQVLVEERLEQIWAEREEAERHARWLK